MCSYNSICVQSPPLSPTTLLLHNHAQKRITGFYCVLNRLLLEFYLKHAPNPDPTPGQTPYPARPDSTPNLHPTCMCLFIILLGVLSSVCFVSVLYVWLALDCLALSFVCLCHVFFLRVVLFAARKKWTPECLLTFALFIRFENLLFTGIPLTFLFAVNEFNMFAECQVCRA